MTSILFFIYFIIILTSLLLIINFIFAVHKPYKQKNGPFECGYDSFQQTRMQFSIVFITFGLMFMLFDLEIVMITPMMVNIIEIEGFGLSVVIAFILILTLGFVFELGKNALKIETKQEKKERVINIPHSTTTQSSVNLRALSWFMLGSINLVLRYCKLDLKLLTMNILKCIYTIIIINKVYKDRSKIRQYSDILYSITHIIILETTAVNLFKIFTALGKISMLLSFVEFYHLGTVFSLLITVTSLCIVAVIYINFVNLYLYNKIPYIYLTISLLCFLAVIISLIIIIHILYEVINGYILKMFTGGAGSSKSNKRGPDGSPGQGNEPPKPPKRPATSSTWIPRSGDEDEDAEGVPDSDWEAPMFEDAEGVPDSDWETPFAEDAEGFQQTHPEAPTQQNTESAAESTQQTQTGTSAQQTIGQIFTKPFITKGDYGRYIVIDPSGWPRLTRMPLKEYKNGKVDQWTMKNQVILEDKHEDSHLTYTDEDLRNPYAPYFLGNTKKLTNKYKDMDELWIAGRKVMIRKYQAGMFTDTPRMSHAEKAKRLYEAKLELTTYLKEFLKRKNN